ncbi:MAG: PAS domain S-box protein [Ignavibacteria bacterium]
MKVSKRPQIQKKRYFVLFALIVTSLVVWGGIAFYMNYERIIKTEKEKELRAISNLKSEQISEWIRERGHDIKYFSQSSIILTDFEKWIKNREDIKLSKTIEERLRLIKDGRSYLDVQILTAEGEILFSFIGEKKLDDYMIQFHRQCVNEKRIVFSDLNLCNEHKTIHYDILSPLINDGKEVFGVILIRINPQDYLYPLIKKWPTSSNTAETIILRKEGDSALYLNDLRHYDGSALKLKLPLTDTQLSSVQGALGYEGIFEGHDYRGVEVFSFIRKIPNTDWIMVTKVDKEEMFKELKLLSFSTNIFTFAFILFIFAGFTVLYNIRQKNIFKELYKTEKSLSNTLDEFRTTLYSIGEAVITSDLYGNVRSINLIAENLTGWKEQDAVGKPLNEVFNIIDEITGEKIDIPFDAALKDGKVINLQRNALLISKKGVKIPISDNRSLIKNENNEITGIVLVFRDQSEERVKLKAIEESEAKYRYLFKSNPQPMWVYDVDTLKFLEINNTAIIKYGYSRDEFLSMTIKDIHPQRDIPSLFDNLELTSNEFNNAGESRHVKKNGDILNVEINSHKINFEGKNARIVIVYDITERKKAEEDRLKYEKRFATAFSLNPSAMSITGVDKGVIMDINNSFTNLFGYSYDEIIGKNVYEINLYENNTIRQAVISDLKSNGTIKNKEINFKTKSGGIITAALSMEILELGEEECILSTFSDITERKQVERIKEIQYNLANTVVNSKNLYELFESTRNELNKIIDASNFFVALYDSKTNMLYSPFEEGEDEKIEKWSAENSLTGMIVKEKRSLLLSKESIRKLADQKKIQLFGSRAESWLGVPLKIGQNVIGAIVVQNFEKKNAYDAKSQVLMELIARELSIYIDHKKSEELLHRLSIGIEQSPVCIIVTDYDGNIDYVNPKFSEITGYSFDEVHGKNPNILKSGEQKNEFYKEMWDTIKSGKDWHGELHNKKKNSELYWESAIISPIHNDEGKITHFIGIKEDITDKKNLITDLVKAKENAEEMNRLKSSFLANMSHELRTPLNGILGFAEILNEELKNEETGKMSKIIFDSGKRLHNTLNQILNLSSLQAEVVKLKKDNIVLNDIVEESFTLYLAEAKKKNLDIKLKNSEKTITIYSDKEIILNALNNVVDNAIKYTINGGVTISLLEDEKDVVIEVADTGIGIKEENIDIIFDEFRQASEGFSRSFEGTGLGLSICKKYMKLLGGSIKVESVYSEGSTFRIELPKSFNKVIEDTNNDLENKNEKSDIIKIPESLESNSKILYVENDVFSQALVKAVLNKYAIIDMANDAKEAIRKTKENDYALILMDINLGSGMDGKEVTKIIKSDSRYESVPIVAITAFAMEGDSEEFLACGCTHYLSKPFNNEKLQNLVLTILGKKN